ncbi:hypothetical protein Tco_1559228, partial [Tanacetum coccineum]
MVTTRRNSDDDVPNFEAMIAAAVANALPNLTASLRTQITNDIRNGARPSGGGGGDATPQGIHVWIERFTKLKPLAFRSAATPAEAEDWITHMEKLEAMLLPILVLGLLFVKWVLDRIVNTDYTNVAQVAAAARNIELLHESGNSNKRDRDGNRIQNRGQDQQENRGRHDQGQHEYRGRQDQNVEHRGRQDRGYDLRRQDFWGQDQRFNGRNGQWNAWVQ